ncbi:PspC domain-containing protein [Lentiprolixibacter aurantiacus]|uniref:PspC domain-containing protein n=1 Tax=Lentiprolixibacter aurantiacus TaxID=2993939 RepID=A0AAE3MMY8_9FLAO|nr:PspC domain-containing protein [Lentiprolixibacter aurantiacus]MCX2720306.1 PspC domain-containing protein [Lentiprolixibacter aurantiacus]
MNKTVNINLANILFHIDEKAFNKLQRYLEAIKRSFAGTTGSDEIISDIEARIAELFHEKMESERQVITMKEVDEVIQIMGQPEDYMVDEDIFEDAPSSSSGATQSKIKKLYRDIDNKYIGGVCAGLEHYLGFDALWIRIIFIILGLFTGFGFIAYILLWILVPEAATTAQKLDMTGEPVNISNIERKVKEGFEDVAERVKSVDYEEVGNKVKQGGKSFFDTLGDIIMFFFKVIGKFVGILLIIIGAASLIGLFIGLFSVGILDVIHIPGVDFYEIVNYTDAPVWLVSLLTFFAVGIPFFFLLYLGLKILVTNLKSIGNIAKFSLLGVWLISIIGLMVLGVKQAAAHAYSGSSTVKEELYQPMYGDTLNISMQRNELYEEGEQYGIGGLYVTQDEEGNRLLYSDDIRFDIRKSEDSLAHIRIRKDANGSSFEDARERAASIDYQYALQNGTLVMDNYLTTAYENKMRDQEVRIAVYLPEGTVVQLDDNTKRHLGRITRYDKDLYRSDIVTYTWEMQSNGELKCLDCPDDIDRSGDQDAEGRIIINREGVDVNINNDGESFKMKLDEDGLRIKADEG